MLFLQYPPCSTCKKAKAWLDGHAIAYEARHIKEQNPTYAELSCWLAKNDIYGGVHYRDNTEFSMYTYAQGTCPKAHEITQHIITMPLHLYLTDEDVRKIIRVVNDFVK